jgi:hypothetical protein
MTKASAHWKLVLMILVITLFSFSISAANDDTIVGETGEVNISSGESQLIAFEYTERSSFSR